jgi:hypothetical protein
VIAEEGRAQGRCHAQLRTPADLTSHNPPCRRYLLAGAAIRLVFDASALRADSVQNDARARWPSVRKRRGMAGVWCASASSLRQPVYMAGLSRHEWDRRTSAGRSSRASTGMLAPALGHAAALKGTQADTCGMPPLPCRGCDLETSLAPRAAYSPYTPRDNPCVIHGLAR